MKLRISQDLAGGLVLILIGSLGLFFIRDLSFGTTFRIGPGFLPTVVSWAIVMIGAVLAIRSWAVASPQVPVKKLMPVLMVLLAFTVFGLLIESAGLVISSLVLVVMGARAADTFAWKHALWLAVMLTIFAVILFSVVLKLSIPVWPKWI